jgi:signal transduction histidine kinase/small nuclear ribonucleoprotein (snRNP)-like protein
LFRQISKLRIFFWTFISISVVTLLFILFSIKNQDDIFNEDIKNKKNAFSKVLDCKVTHYKNIVHSILSITDIQNYLNEESFNQLFIKFKNSNKFIDRIELYDKNLNLVLSSNKKNIFSDKGIIKKSFDSSTPKSSFELTTLGVGFVYTYPIYENSEIKYVLKIGVKVEYFLSTMDSMVNEYLDSLVFVNYSKIESLLKDFPNHFKKEGFVSLKDNKFFEYLNIDFNQDYSQSLLLDNKHIICTTFKLWTYNKEEIGRIVISYDSSKIYYKFYDFVYKVLLISILLLVISTFTIFKLFNIYSKGMLEKQKELEDLNLDIKELNESLEHKVKEKTEQLLDLNQKLENRVIEEVQKSRQKDEIMSHQARLIQMGEMVEMIAHQWRQPLSSITSILSLLKIKILTNRYEANEFNDNLNNIEKITLFLSNTIDDFRTFFRPEKEQEITNFKDMFDETLLLLDSSLKNHNIKVTTNVEDIENVYVYKNEVKQVILDILKNAKDELVSRNKDNPNIYVLINKKTISIIDNAGGISNDIIDKIFDPYFSTKSDTGTGIGLYMSKIIIEQHNKGELKVSSIEYNLEKCAKFEIVL